MFNANCYLVNDGKPATILILVNRGYPSHNKGRDNGRVLPSKLDWRPSYTGLFDKDTGGDGAPGEAIAPLRLRPEAALRINLAQRFPRKETITFLL